MNRTDATFSPASAKTLPTITSTWITALTSCRSGMTTFETATPLFALVYRATFRLPLRNVCRRQHPNQ
jgi:hypothetical protein